MITLRHFGEEDLPVLGRYLLPGRTDDEIRTVLARWETLTWGGRYFEMFAVLYNSTPVGSVSLFQHSGYIISAGPEIFPEYRRRGYASAGLTLAYEHAKQQGYRIAAAEIRKDNTASIRLHEKAGFLRNGEYVNRNGREIYLYLKLL